MDYAHTPVMLAEIIRYLAIKPGCAYADATTGNAGHASAIARAMGYGTLICVDQDGDAITAATEVLAPLRSDKLDIRIYRDNFANIGEVMKQAGVSALDGIMADLGISSRHVDNRARGFNYGGEPSILDMRMDDRNPLTAAEVINAYAEDKLTGIFFEFGEERYSRSIARAIVKRRAEHPIETTAELNGIIKSALPGKALANNGAHQTIKRIYQSVRVEVNSELSVLSSFLEQAADLLAPGGRCCILDFQSLEDRIIKNMFREWEDPCICPKGPGGFPICVCGREPKARIITRKPIVPTDEEVARNPRARSAKLRVAERL